MKMFDRIEKREVDGYTKLFAVDDQENNACFLMAVMIKTSDGTSGEYSLSVNIDGLNFAKMRKVFANAQELEAYSDSLLKLSYDVSVANKKKEKRRAQLKLAAYGLPVLVVLVVLLIVGR